MREKKARSYCYLVQEEYVQRQHKNNLPSSDPLHMLLIAGINAL